MGGPTIKYKIQINPIRQMERKSAIADVCLSASGVVGGWVLV